MQVFLSYDAADRKIAENLASRLKELGFTVWYPDQDLFPGDNSSLEIGKALQQSNAMVVLLSPRSAKSSLVLRDIEFALGSLQYQNRLIPVIVKPSSHVPWILNTLHAIPLAKDISLTADRVALRLRNAGSGPDARFSKRKLSTGRNGSRLRKSARVA
jgi:hypothetical protein